MKKLLSLLILGTTMFSYAQNNQDKKTFNNSNKLYNDWSVSAFGGLNLLQNTDFLSWSGDYITPGYDVQLQVNKQITHAFGLSLQYQMGKTRQKGGAYDNTPWNNSSGMAHGKTEYHGVSVLADINASNLLRRVDNKSEFKWSLHLYGGVGLLGYKAHRNNFRGSGNEYVVITDQKMDLQSLYAQIGSGIRYKLNNKFDLELRAMYVMSGDEEFDGSGKPEPGFITPAENNYRRNDNMVTASLGIHYKIGKKDEALQWVSPFTGINNKNNQSPQKFDFDCLDEDKDGVCDQWDKCLDTPEGVRVDGSGCSLDSDGDGVPDSEDKCPTIAGPPTNGGCPEKILRISGDDIATKINTLLEGIEFDYNSDKIREQSYVKLDNTVEILLANPEYKFIVEGHTDAAGNADYNQMLSEKRAKSVINYLANKRVDVSKLSPVGKGKNDLKWPECNPVTNCPAWKNLENRRVIFKEVQ